MKRSCLNCKWFYRFPPGKHPMGLYPNGLMICRWMQKNNLPRVPAYITEQISLALCYPYHLEKDVGKYCGTFQAASSVPKKRATANTPR